MVSGAVRPARLGEGDLVELVSPAGAADPAVVEVAVGVLTGWGLRVRLGEHALGRRHDYLSGTDEQRLADVNHALRDPEVRAVVCVRGGYGTQRIVDGVDFAAVRADPKLVMGFSDITALHSALWCEARLATVHGPTGSQLVGGLDSRTVRSARSILFGAEPVVVAAEADEETFGVRVAGRASGVLLGGNLTLLATTAGTRHRPDPTGAILLLEDVGEEPYRVDRSLVQLRRSGWLEGVAGVAVGQFTNCVGEDKVSPTVAEVLAEELGALGVPVLGGLPIGHGEQQVAVGLGVRAVLDADAGSLTIQAVTS
ncbi:LD-carboxypeptidase [Actinoplanes sp. NBRC 103695]|uniref:S66 peptidase family protein n=1 Tax=Actinoplanes sp. NBRC 103695 TaxID=3032202 RepID=UPI002556D49A|nr:LD-carboxypeptidase [Actinoplanes sp. NBRC 103695]